MILSLAFLLLFIFYTSGGFKKLLEFYRFPDPEPLPNLYQGPKPEPAPVKIIPEPVKVEPVTIPEPAPDQIPDPEPLKPAGDRRKLERIAANVLTAAGCKFDVWTYCRFKSDIELMDIIKDYNLNK